MKYYVPKPYQQLPVSDEIKEPSASNYRFVVVGDRCGIPVPHRFEQAMQTIADVSAQFVIGVGDYVDGYWLTEQDAHQEWGHVEELMATCQKPFLQTPGNHDYGNAVMQKVWHDRKGADYFALRYGQDLFCFVNSEDPSAQMPEWIGEKIRELSTLLEQRQDQLDVLLAGIVQQMESASPKDFGGIDVSNTLQPAISQSQLAFFQEVIQENMDCRHLFLITHEPAWKCEDPSFQQLLDSCQGKSCTILCGHLHDFEYAKVQGHHALQLQQTGALPHGQTRDGYLVVEVGEELHVTMYDLEGTKLSDVF